MRTFGFVSLAFVVGLVAGFGIFVLAGFAWLQAADVFDRDGGLAMAIFFTLGPLGGFLVACIAATGTALVLARKRRAIAAGTRAPARRWPLAVRAVVAAVASALAVYAVVWCAFWMLTPMSFSTYEVALAVSLLPVTLPLAAAVIAAAVVLIRRAPREITPP
jgi:hypothetical protein